MTGRPLSLGLSRAPDEWQGCENRTDPCAEHTDPPMPAAEALLIPQDL